MEAAGLKPPVAAEEVEVDRVEVERLKVPGEVAGAP